ncbi:urease accessory protein UreE [Leptolyngbya cf. ectocarpi LEGE 11479]|uniref:Urease accessory protein UreE n=1 Tax=Leptolyngbya cf. ectocarpi LEGE 11479 TaxID=1828722 RepID=A0A928X0S1_LEPEC|nr:urease accessory protein UreE [Leptolyngbya ectocarpi]MBE9065721.1 urease accessory protein UreE [Leptolyngbya cf. ectocarpi LEGE 11479]
MYVFTQKGSPTSEPTLTLELTADERTRSRYRYMISSEITDRGEAVLDLSTRAGQPDTQDEIYLELPRGTVLRHGDCLRGDDHQQVLRIVAKPEPVLTVRAQAGAESSLLLRAAYHLGNRHVALEVGADYLRLVPDSVLESMLHQLGMTVIAETMPFQPESGAYGHHH